MRRILTALGIAVGLSCVIAAQSAPPAFDAADVQLRPRSPNPNPIMTGGVVRSGRYDLRYATMLDLISKAYNLPAESVLGGPSWLEWDRFDIAAKAADGTSQEALRTMLQTLLVDRFKLVVRKDTRPLPAFGLSLGSGKHKMKPASGDGQPGCQGIPQPQSPGAAPLTTIACRNMTMATFVTLLRGLAAAYVTDPAVDQTDLTGPWDFDLKWTPRASLAVAGSDGITLFDAIDKQLGLKLAASSIPSPVLVVDGVNRQPTPNPPNTARLLPPRPPAEFEVADVKFSEPNTPIMMRLQVGGRVDLQGVNLKMVIMRAWDLNDDQLLAGAPGWLDKTQYTVHALASSAMAGSSIADAQVDIDDLSLMLRNLLRERFKLATHTEQRPVNAFTLLADKPKLQPANPADRTRCWVGVPPGAKDPRESNPALSRAISCQNVTMAQFAELLLGLAPAYVPIPVEDGTGLAGAWNFTFAFSPFGAVPGQGGGGRGVRDGGVAPPNPNSTDPTGAMSVFDAVNKQLGLKLEMRKRSMPVLVIDHVEEKPIDN
jgi:uncharacterized protein (TIGR03435 family)